jgi:hypothetical protein
MVSFRRETDDRLRQANVEPRTMHELHLVVDQKHEKF